jgi:hypothetical protein
MPETEAMRLLLTAAAVGASFFASGCLRQESRDVPDVTGDSLEEALDDIDGNAFVPRLTPEISGICDGVRLNAYTKLELPKRVDSSACRVVEQFPEPGAYAQMFSHVQMTVR